MCEAKTKLQLDLYIISLYLNTESIRNNVLSFLTYMISFILNMIDFTSSVPELFEYI